jgi:hypothetical protein
MCIKNIFIVAEIVANLAELKQVPAVAHPQQLRSYVQARV